MNKVDFNINSRHTIKLKGTVTAVTGINISRKDDNFAGGGFSKDLGRLPRAGAKTQHTPVFIQGASLRGALRRAALSRIRQHINVALNEDKPFDLATHYMLSQGVDITGKAKGEKSMQVVGAEDELRNKNPLLSLFGRWKMAGHISVDSLHPKFQSEKSPCFYVEGAGARTNDFVRSPELVGVLSETEQEELKKLLSDDEIASKDTQPLRQLIDELDTQRKQSQDRDEKASLKQEVDELRLQIKEIDKEQKGGREAIQRPLDGFECIKPNTEFDHQILIQRANEDEIAITLEMLSEFSRNPVIGGHINLGCGTISMDYEISTFPPLSDKPIILGQVTINKDGFTLVDYTANKVLENARANFIKKLADSSFSFDKFLIGKDVA
jgi:CRISPR/Cas system CSM-associated protein Csm3 (group 7 of RAMP superfamily)